MKLCPQTVNFPSQLCQTWQNKSLKLFETPYSSFNKIFNSSYSRPFIASVFDSNSTSLSMQLNQDNAIAGQYGQSGTGISNPCSGSGFTGTGNWNSPDSGRNLPELIYSKTYFIQQVLIKAIYAF
jgi:hypothetical protein